MIYPDGRPLTKGEALFIYSILAVGVGLFSTVLVWLL